MDEGKRRPSRVKTSEEIAEHKAAVVSIFGEARLDDEVPLDPDSVRPQNDWADVKEEVRAGGNPERIPRDYVRMGRRWTQLLRDINDGKVTMREFVKTLTPEELVRGQMKASDGSFRGAPPKWVPSEFHAECTRELLKRGDQLWREAYLEAIKVYSTIAADASVEPQHRLKAAQYVIERIAGKTPEKVELTVAQPWETLISGIVAEAEDDAISRATRLLGAADDS